MRKEKAVGRFLAVKERLKDQAIAAWKAAQKTMKDAGNTLKQRREALRQLEARMTQLATSDAVRLLEGAEFVAHARRARDQAEVAFREATEAAERAQVLAAQLGREVRAMERVRAQLRAERIARRAKAEQRFTDEVAGRTRRGL